MSHSRAFGVFGAFAFFITVSSHAEWKISDARFVVRNKEAIAGIVPLPSNNNVSLEMHDGRLYMAWRSGRDHFASPETSVHVVSSADQGSTWEPELTVAIGADIREPFLKSMGGKLHFFYFEGGAKAAAFKPKRVVERTREFDGSWSDPKTIMGPKQVLWEIREHDGKYYRIAYRGPHYRFVPGKLDLLFEVSADGENWSTLPGEKSPIVYRGGVCEVAFEFDAQGNLWGVGRNEDGDSTGFGTQIYYARADRLGKFRFLKTSLRERYDSPRMFRHGDELYLISRRASEPFDRRLPLPFNLQRWMNLGIYSLRTMRTALFRLNREARQPEWIQDLPSAGDNAFPSVVQTGPDRFLVANYTSPLKHQDWKWIKGQKSKEGTGIYLVDLNWKP